MKIQVSNSFILTEKGYIVPQNWQKTNTEGIKSHSKLKGIFHSFAGKAVQLHDGHKIWYVDKKSLRTWAESQGAHQGFDLKHLDKFLKGEKVPISKKVVAKKIKEINKFIMSLDENALKNIDQTMTDWMKQVKEFLSYYDFELSADKEKEISNTIKSHVHHSELNYQLDLLQHMLKSATSKLFDKAPNKT